MRSITLTLALAALALPAAAEITLFSRDGFDGKSFSTQRPVRNLEREGFANRASSAIVRGGRYEICDGRAFEGRCVVLRPGQYPSLRAMGLDNAVSSVRPVSREARVEERRFAPPPPVAHDYRRRRDEKLFEADVVAVRAVYGRPEQRCWIEREQVAGPSEANVGGAVLGGLIGGILGHQVGSGRGNDAATAAGAIAGAAIGANTGGGSFGTTYTRDVQRCAPSQASGRPEYWDVRYRFRGVERTVQMARPPGRTITVNRDGEPRA
ncbi:MAG TPA: beta/gamma crystallin-related protein [Usitatibacter sp.]|nr:beta/gamma crystallin-related protein [Usitatibacter sp.]